MSDIKSEQHLDGSMSASVLFVMLIEIGMNLILLVVLNISDK